RHAAGCSRHDVIHRTIPVRTTGCGAAVSGLPAHVARVLVGAPATPDGVAQSAVLGAFGVLDLPHQVCAHPLRIATVRRGHVVDRRGLARTGAQALRDLLEVALGEARADPARVVQRAVHVRDGEQEGADRPGPLPLAVPPADHDDLLVAGVLELDPGAG